MSISQMKEYLKRQKIAKEEVKELAEAEAVRIKAKAELQELTVSELVKQNAELKAELVEFKELFHKFSDVAMKNDEMHKQEISELHERIHSLESHCSGGVVFHDDMD